ncbi:unnamed protein product [Rangifer tarandus platyrhynchus]|uniref:Uncharacterized protein n=9 Tax=Rangifer tarandus platyrhynchus TaxID=3082113 RepID=A0ABN8XMA0_RANTA|nr:unnamed protein product [Rangifer tarandus platyrhynchus]CAI9149313.1 unnamed protein product [Rangifer tarandus platyrhynchus]CAI9150457.1 unnamed protein product [Rangifer tarandus platyrhynchus]CAI9175631.1 unnamed protein product [Rangifer tarandus platyrhynchus]CAI9175633.1 unnamed protein product [Rangifer tarandus platyrhynchus]
MVKTHKTKQIKEIGSLPEKEFKVMILKMTQNLEDKWKHGSGRHKVLFNKDLEKFKQSTINNTITEIKNTLVGINSRVSEAEQLHELEDRLVEITEAKHNKGKRIKTGQSTFSINLLI